MNILVIGEEYNLKECRSKLGPGHEYSLVGDHRDSEKYLNGNDVVFDFIIDEEPSEISVYQDKDLIVFLNTVKISLSELLIALPPKRREKFFGFNGLPTFMQHDALELCINEFSNHSVLENLFNHLRLQFIIVEDRVGMVTPRIICMIINEAFYTVQEKTASRQDIDMAMKLGTNYPFGPFEWCKKIGTKHVYELLDALFEDTKDDRYKICPLLKTEYLQEKEVPY